MTVISLSYFEKEDVVSLSRDLLGKYIFTQIDDTITGGMIVETEAYGGVNDKASHAYNNRKTTRTLTMYQDGGTIYVYLCYGMHHLLNIVTNKKNIPHAILLRAIEPTIGIDTMLKRRKRKKIDRFLTSGPGALSQALGVTTNLNGIKASPPLLWFEDKSKKISNNNISKSPRVGVSYAKEDALLLWRFRIKNSTWTSTAK